MVEARRRPRIDSCLGKRKYSVIPGNRLPYLCYHKSSAKIDSLRQKCGGKQHVSGGSFNVGAWSGHAFESASPDLLALGEVAHK
jgi:hypothetical protein